MEDFIHINDNNQQIDKLERASINYLIKWLYKRIPILMPLTFLSFTLNADPVTVQMVNQYPAPGNQENFEYIPKHVSPINAYQRDHFFEKIGIAGELQNFDEVQKNLLFLRLQQLRLEKLQQLYPKISPRYLTLGMNALRNPN